MARLEQELNGELDRVSQTLTGRIRQLTERYATPLPQLTEDVATLVQPGEGTPKQVGPFPGY